MKNYPAEKCLHVTWFCTTRKIFTIFMKICKLFKNYRMMYHKFFMLSVVLQPDFAHFPFLLILGCVSFINEYFCKGLKNGPSFAIIILFLFLLIHKDILFYFIISRLFISWGKIAQVQCISSVCCTVNG